MLRSRLTRVAVWAPLPPQRGSVAEQNAALLPELARHVEIAAVVEDWLAPLTSPYPGVEVIGASEFAAVGEPADLSIYHMADDFDAHSYIHEALIRTPGLVVLHDLDLSNFYRTKYQRDPEEFRTELWRNHGVHVPERDVHRAMLLRRILDASLGVVVDNPGTAALIAERFPAARIAVVPRPRRPIADDVGDLDIRAELGWDDGDLVVGTIGVLGASRRLPLSVAVAAGCQAADGRVRLLVAGRAPDPVVIDAADAAISAMGPAAGVLATDLSDREFDACVSACDLLLDLRTGTGSVPSSILNGFAQGVPAIVTDLPQFRHLDPACCWRVAEPPQASIQEAIGRIADVLSRRVDLAASRDAARRAAARSDPSSVASHQLEVAAAIVAERPRIAGSSPVPDRPLTVHGDFMAATGLMEVGRMLTRALLDSPLDLRIADIVSLGPTHSAWRNDPEFAGVSRQRSLDGHQVWFANINEFRMIPNEALRPPGVTGRVIAVWFWELPSMPPEIARHVNRVDEIWVASQFVRDTMRRHTKTPVQLIPIPIEPRLPVSFARRDYQLPEDAVLYFFNMDAYSIVGRKNPFGVIAAFKRAFEAAECGRAATLVIKSTNLAQRPEFASALHRAMDDIGGIVLSDDLGRSEMNGLLGSIDVYVSLHRSEGFGIGMAEAMALGKPVVATAFSGSADFLRPAISCPVGYRVRPITDLDHEWWPEGTMVYPPGFAYWAEPDLDGAARWMRLLFEQPRLRSQIGRAAAAHMADQYSPRRARQVVLDLLRDAPVAAV